MTWTIPLLAITSATITLALLTITPDSVTIIVALSPLRVSMCPFLREELSAFAVTTWYNSISLSWPTLAGSSKLSRRPAGSAAKASFVGAKTVSGPSPERAPIKSAAATALARVERLSLATARSTILLLTLDGVSTESTPWTTPLSAFISTKPASMRMIELSLTRGGLRLITMVLPW